MRIKIIWFWKKKIFIFSNVNLTAKCHKKKVTQHNLKADNQNKKFQKSFKTFVILKYTDSINCLKYNSCASLSLVGL